MNMCVVSRSTHGGAREREESCVTKLNMTHRLDEALALSANVARPGAGWQDKGGFYSPVGELEWVLFEERTSPVCVYSGNTVRQSVRE